MQLRIEDSLGGDRSDVVVLERLDHLGARHLDADEQVLRFLAFDVGRECHVEKVEYEQELIKQGLQFAPQPEFVVHLTAPAQVLIVGLGARPLALKVRDLLLELESQKFFVLLSGRWYRGDALVGPWVSIPSAALPESFASITEESEMGHLLAWVPGTDLALEAVLGSRYPSRTED